jgi:hypothetical protein
MSVDLTSTNTNEYRAGLNSGPQGDDSEDLGTVDLFGDSEAMDGHTKKHCEHGDAYYDTRCDDDYDAADARAEDKANIDHPGTDTWPQDPCTNFRCLE